MAFQIIKENTTNVWRHSFTSSSIPDIILSSGFFRFNGIVYQLFSDSGGSLRTANLQDIEVIDETDLGAIETFSTVLGITTRLKALDYPYFNEFSISGLISSDSPNDLVLGSDGKLLVQSSAAGQSWDFDISKFHTGGATIGNYNGVVFSASTNGFSVNKGTTDISTITNIVGEARFFVAPVDCFLSSVQVHMNGNGRFGLLMDTGSVVVIYDEAINQDRLDNFVYDGFNIVIPQNIMFKPYLLMDGGGFFGSFSMTISEIPT